MDSDEMMEAVLQTINPMSHAQPEYKHEADFTLLPHLNVLLNKIQTFKEFLEKIRENTPRRARLDNIKKIIEYYNTNSFQIRYDFAFKIVYIHNFNNVFGNKLVEDLFLSFEKFFSYFDKQSLIFLNFNRGMNTEENALYNNIDFDIHERSIELCNNIITIINKLMEYIKGEFPLLDTGVAKGNKKYRSRCPNGTRKNKKTGKCDKKKSRKSSKSKKPTMKNKK